VKVKVENFECFSDLSAFPRNCGWQTQEFEVFEFFMLSQNYTVVADRLMIGSSFLWLKEARSS
jgi:hypothetical protein